MGFRGNVRTVVLQLGFVTIAPSHFRCLRCCSMRLMWSQFISGFSIGTSGSILCADALLTITYPADAKSSSPGPATSEGRAEKMMSTSFTTLGFMSTTSIWATASGIGVVCRHLEASPYVLPLLLSEAATVVTSNHGCPSSSWTKICPTFPVAPNTAAFNILVTF